MAPLDETEFRTIIEDARARHGGIVNLIYVTDQQAMLLLRLYATLGIATSSGAIAGLVGQPMIARPLAWALVAASITLILGAALCLRVLQAARINVPGRDPEFWLWALRDDIDRKTALRGYLENLQVKIAANRSLNIKTATALKWAKRCGAAMPIAALMTGAAAMRWPF